LEVLQYPYPRLFVDHSVCLQYGMRHAFVFEFANKEDWKYYIDQDPAHWGIAMSIKDTILEKVQTVDFVDGVFEGSLR
jgi:hypothetical protein